MNGNNKASIILFLASSCMWINIGAGYMSLSNRMPRDALGHGLAALCSYYFVRVGEKTDGRRS